MQAGDKMREKAKAPAQTARAKSHRINSHTCYAIATLHPIRRSWRVLGLRLLNVFLALAAGALLRAADGPTVFADHCASCHGPDGKGRTPAGKKIGAKDLAESRIKDEAIALQIADGVKDQRGADRMPSFKSKLTPDEIAALVSFVKTFRR